MEEKLQSHASQQEITPREHDICSFLHLLIQFWETEEVTNPMLLGRKLYSWTCSEASFPLKDRLAKASPVSNKFSSPSCILSGTVGMSSISGHTQIWRGSVPSWNGVGTCLLHHRSLNFELLLVHWRSGNREWASTTLVICLISLMPEEGSDYHHLWELNALKSYAYTSLEIRSPTEMNGGDFWVDLQRIALYDYCNEWIKSPTTHLDAAAPVELMLHPVWGGGEARWFPWDKWTSLL